MAAVATYLTYEQTLDQRPETMNAITLKNGMVIFVEQIAFIHVQPSPTKEGTITPEIHVHFPAALTGPKGSRSMRAVVGEAHSQDFTAQLEKFEIDCTHIRRRLAELKQTAAGASAAGAEATAPE